MPKIPQSATRKVSAQLFQLKPLVAGIRIVALGGLFAGAPAQAEVPVPGATLPDGTVLPFVGYGDASQHLANHGNNLVIDQHSEQAILNWQHFNVGKDNTVQFVQPDSSAVALNRIYDADGSTILGHVTANGQIYLYNQNGFVFGKDSVIDANSVVVTTMNISDDVIKNSNIADAYNSKQVAAFDNGGAASKDITVHSGAQIKAGKAGRIILAAPNVNNAGTLTTGVQGQIILVASQDKVYLQANNPKNGSAWNGLLVEVGTGGKVTNTGDVSVRQGNVTLAGFAVNQDGRVNATTSVNINGSIRLQAGQGLSNTDKFSLDGVTHAITAAGTTDSNNNKASVEFGPNSHTNIVADSAGGSSLDSAVKPQSAIEIVGQTVALNGNAAIHAPGAKVDITATDNLLEPTQGHAGRIFVDNKASIDVSGLKNVEIAANRNVAKISVQSFELRNSPLQLTGVLKGQDVWVDTSLNTSIIDTSKAAANIQRGIEERMTVGGQINMTASGDVLVDKSANLSIAGGSLAYAGGYIHTTKLINDFGQLVDISAADPNQHYAGIFGNVSEAHTKWGVTQNWNVFDNSTPGTYRSAYIQGADAGALNISTPHLAWNGNLHAGVSSGANQRSPAATPSGGTFNIDLATFSSIQDVRFQTAKNNVDFSLSSPFPTNATTGKAADLVLNSGLLNNSGVKTLTVKTLGDAVVAADAKINMTPGGHLTVAAGNINVNGSVKAASGNITLNANTGNVTLAKQAALDVSGLWVNDQQATLWRSDFTPTTPLYLQGGAVNISAYNAIKLPAGSQIHADGGGWLAANGALSSGAGGSIDLESSSTNGSAMQLAGQLSAFGLSQGGSLTLGANNIVVGAAATGEPATELALGVSNGNFNFAQQLSFSSITLKGNVGNSNGNITVKSDVQLDLKTENRQLLDNYHSMATGSSLRDFSSVALLPENQRQAVKLSMSGGDSTLNVQAGSSITLDKSTLNNASAISLTSLGSIFVDGELNAPAGQINLTVAADPGLAYDATQAVWVGQHAQLLAAGTTRLNPVDGLGRQTGLVLDGGAVNITANRGYAVLEKGSLIDVSGTHAQLSVPTQNANAYEAGMTPTTIGSNAGKVSITSAEGAVLDGSFKAAAGTATTRAGSLSVAMDNSKRNIDAGTPAIADSFPYGSLNINVEQSAAQIIPDGATLGINLDQLHLQGQTMLGANTVMAGGFSDLSLQLPQDISAQNTNGQVTFTGNVDLKTAGHINIDSPVIKSAPLNGETTDTVKLSSPYIMLGSSTTRSVSGSSVAGNGSFVANAKWLEVEGASLWNGFSSVALNSDHDLRTLGVLLGARDFLGEMVTAATINLQASQIYPATLTDFTFKTTGAAQQINISGVNTDKSPLSAGGSLTFQAPVINQAGVLKAPLGSINLIAADKLTLAAGSLTSVSAAGQIIPFGVVQGGLNWLYPLDATQNQIISTPPTKQINLSAPVINQAKNSIIDLSGGGDLISHEFKPVASDFPDFLQPGSASYDGSFAIIPSLHSALAPYDPATMVSWNNSATGTAYAEGSQVYLQASAELPAGYYTILPAYYALLPGAYLVTPQANSMDRSSTTYSASGLPIVSGYESLAGTAVRDARTSAFQIESSAQVLVNHPQYLLYCAGSCSNTLTKQEMALNAANQGVLAANIATDLDYLQSKKLLNQNFYANQAKTNGGATPLLPVDSGQISISAQSALTLDGTLKVAAPGGRGARMDIAADNIEVVTSLSTTPAPDTLQILDSNLNNLKVDSLFLGGSRTSNADSFALAAPAASGSTSLTLVSTAGWAKGDVLKGVGILDGTVINSISGNVVTLNKPLTADVSAGANITDTKAALIDGSTNLFVTSQQVTFDSGVNLNLTDLVAAATNKVTVAAGANLTAAGTVNTGDSKFNLIGDSALLRLSADQQVSVNRAYYGATPGLSGQLAVAAGATLTAAKSMLLDSSLSTQMDGNIVMHGGSLNLSAGSINIGDAGAAANPNALNLSNQQLASLNVDQLILNSRGNVNFYGNIGAEDSSGNPVLGSDGSQQPLSFKQLVINAAGISGYGAGDQAVKLKATDLTLENLANAASGAIGSGAGLLSLSATDYIQGAGNFAVNGFSTANLSVDNSFTASGVSHLSVAAAMNLTTGYLTADSGAKLSLDASGYALNILGNGSVASAAATGLGGAMSFVADSVAFDAYALLPSGNLSLQAKGGVNGDVSIGTDAHIDLAGRTVTYANAVDYTPGGQLNVTADHGHVSIAGNANLDLSSGGGSAAGGSMLLNAVEQWVSIADTAAIKAAAGSAQFDVASFSTDSSFDKLMTVLKNAGVNDIINFRSRHADIVSSTDITAQAVDLVADHNKIDISGKIITTGINGSYQISATGSAGNVLTIADTRGLQVGDQLSGPGLAANTVITKISGHDVSLSAAPTAISAGATITDITALGDRHTVTGLNQTTSNVLGLSSITGLHAGDSLSGGGLAAGTTIAYVPTKKTTLNGVSDYWVVLSASPTVSIDASTTISDINSNTNLAIVNHDNSWTPTNVLTLDNTADLKVGEYLVGAGLAANTTITGISGNNVTLSALPTAEISTGAALTTVDSTRLAAVNGGAISLSAGDTITLHDGSQLNTSSSWGKGGDVLLSSLAAPSAAGAIVLDSGAQLAVGGVSASQGGTVTLRALQDGNSINIHTLKANISGYTALNAEAVKTYTNADFSTSPGADGVIDSTFIAAIQAATQTFMANADISGLQSQNSAITLLPGVEIDYTGNLTLADNWDLSSWRFNGNPGHLVIRTTNSLNFDNSLSDGFSSGSFVNADGSSGGMTVTDQLMRDHSWSFTLSAGADLSSADVNRVAGVTNNVTIGNADSLTPGGNQIKVRTGTGNIQINAGGDINILANGTVYNAGQASSQNPYGNLSNTEVSNYFFVEYPQHGGNLALTAGGNVNGAVSGTSYNDWLLRICCGNNTDKSNTSRFVPTAWGVALGVADSNNQLISSSSAPAFAENIGSFGGGNVSIKAAGNVQNLEVAMPTTGKPIGSITASGKNRDGLENFTSNVIDIQGGGALQVSAGGDIQGGSYFLGKGIADVSAGGAVTTSSAWSNGPQFYSGNTQININAVNGIQVAGVADPMIADVQPYSSPIHNNNQPVSFYSYTDASAVSLRALAGDVILSGGGTMLNLFPASLQVSAFGGSVALNTDINLFPSATGKLNVYAQQSIYSIDANNRATLRMSDYAPNAAIGQLPTAYAPINKSISDLSVNPVFNLAQHASDSSGMPLHLNDLVPAIFATQSGDIRDINLNTPKLTIVKAGRDISNADITIQNIHNSDVSIIDAGRDLIDPLQLSANTGKIISATPPQITVAGPGDLLIKTGRNMDLGASNGVFTIGDKNLVNSQGGLLETNPALIRPYYVSTAAAATGSKQLTLANTTGLVVGEELQSAGLAANTIITAIHGNTVTLSQAPLQNMAAGAVFSTADTSANYFLQTGADAGSRKLHLTDASGLLVGEHLNGAGLAANTTITKISGNTVTLNVAPLRAIHAGSLINQTTNGAKGAYIADINNGANVTVLAGLQGAAPSYVNFIESEAKLKSYISFLQKNEQQLQSNGSSQAQLDIYNTAISQYQALLPVFDKNKQAATALIAEFMKATPNYVYSTDSKALTDFKALPVDQTLALQAQLNDLLLPVLLKEIEINGGASASDKAFGNSQGYAALDAFFNRTTGNWQGNVNMYFSTLQTQSGGDINLLAPGGLINAGLAVAVGFDKPKDASQLGIIAEGQGAVNAVVGQDFLVNTSRVFTLDGGDILIWSSHGSIDAGKGAKTALSVPPLAASYVNGNLVYTQAPSIAGSGIRTQGGSGGSVYLFAPQGVVNAAEAGIAGKNVTISATAVLGAQNIQFSGVGTGVPQASSGSLAAGLTGSSNLGASVSQIAQSAVEDDSKGKNSSMKNTVLGLLSVELLGFGD